MNHREDSLRLLAVWIALAWLLLFVLILILGASS